MLAALETIYELIDVTDYALTFDKKKSFIDMTWKISAHYSALRHAAGERKLRSEVPKHHYVWREAFGRAIR